MKVSKYEQDFLDYWKRTYGESESEEMVLRMRREMTGSEERYVSNNNYVMMGPVAKLKPLKLPEWVVETLSMGRAQAQAEVQAQETQSFAFDTQQGRVDDTISAMDISKDAEPEVDVDALLLELGL